jgi:hypothetical protein
VDSPIRYGPKRFGATAGRTQREISRLLALALNDMHNSVGRDIFKNILCCVRPLPVGGQFRHRLCISNSKMESQAALRRVSRSDHDVAEEILSIWQFDANFRAGGIPVYRRAGQVDLDPVLLVSDVVTVKHRRDLLAGSRIGAHNDVEVTVIVEVCNCRAPRVSDTVHAHRHGNVGVDAIAKILQKDVGFLPVPRLVSPELIRVKFTLFVVIDFRDRGGDVGQSKIIVLFTSNPSVHRVNVLETIVVVIEDHRTRMAQG